MDTPLVDGFPAPSTEGNEIELRGIIGKTRKIIISNGMKNILSKEQ